MFDKWGINRYPFYTRPIDKECLYDFYGRAAELKEISSIQKAGEGVIGIISDRGIGTTSLANFGRFKFKSAFTVPFEIRMEQFENPTGCMESIVYSTAQEIKRHKITSKTAQLIIKQYELKIKDVQFSAGFGGVGVKLAAKQGPKANFQSLFDLFQKLLSDILKSKKKNYSSCIFQLNNMDVPGTIKKEKLTLLLNPLRDVFHTKNTIWFLLGDSGFEQFIKTDMTRISSIVRHWVHVEPISERDFSELYKLRIKNSGPNAVSPFTDEAVKKIAEYTVGTTRFALDLAGRIMEKYADSPIPEIIGFDLVKKHAMDEVSSILKLDSLWEKSFSALKVIRKEPGITSSKISEKIKVSPTNLIKYVKPLLNKDLIYTRKEGRSVKYYTKGIGKFI